MQVWAHTVFKNEERWLWFAVTSVIESVDKLLLWDTGSTDNSWKIAEELKLRYGSKIDLRQCGETTVEDFYRIRQKMIEETQSDWVFVLDGDEVWWKDSINELISVINTKGKNLESIVSHSINPVGDIFHFQSESKGRYKFDERVGHLSIRAMNMSINGLHVEGKYGKEGYYDADGKLIQNRNSNLRTHLSGSYLHLTNLIRSSSRINDVKVLQRNKKYKYEIGQNAPFDFYYPESLFKSRPDYVKSPWENTNLKYKFTSYLEAPFKFTKNLLEIYGKRDR